jgi:O-antigen ligase
MAMVLLAGEGMLGLVVASVGIPLLALTLVRTAWLGLTVAFFVLFLNAPPSRKLLLLLGSCGIAFACLAYIASPTISPDVANAIADRVATFQNLGTDVSANARLETYDAFYGRLADHPFGEGFGVNQSTVTLQNKKVNEAIDSGILETWLVFGVVAGAAYFLALGALVWRAFNITRYSPARLAGCMAVVSSALAMSFLGSAQIGEVGVLEWAALGVILAHDSLDHSRRSTIPAGRLV